MNEETAKQHIKQNYDWLKQYQFQKGQSGNPNGAPKGKRLKTFALEVLEKMSDEDKAEFLKTLDPKTIWEMAEGKAEGKTDITSLGESINPVLVKFIDGKTENN
jgi:Family of unknown function (DUF5681)